MTMKHVVLIVLATVAGLALAFLIDPDLAHTTRERAAKLLAERKSAPEIEIGLHPSFPGVPICLPAGATGETGRDSTLWFTDHTWVEVSPVCAEQAAFSSLEDFTRRWNSIPHAEEILLFIVPGESRFAALVVLERSERRADLLLLSGDHHLLYTVVGESPDFVTRLHTAQREVWGRHIQSERNRPAGLPQ
jgi:hypothetical protein